MPRTDDDSFDPNTFYDGPSKSQVKKDALVLQMLGESLAALPADNFAALKIDDRLRDALRELQRQTAHGARKRQMQYVGKLLRAEDCVPLHKAVTAHRLGKRRDAQTLLDVEQWREQVIANDEGLQRWWAEYPATDTKAFRALVRDARSEREINLQAERTGGSSRNHIKAFRALFKAMKTAMAATDDAV